MKVSERSKNRRIDWALGGLIFLMLKEGGDRDGCREMLLILAVLYLAGVK